MSILIRVLPWPKKGLLFVSEPRPQVPRRDFLSSRLRRPVLSGEEFALDAPGEIISDWVSCQMFPKAKKFISQQIPLLFFVQINFSPSPK